MATEPPETAPEPVETVIVRPPLWQRAIKWVAVAIVTVAALAGLAVIALNTQPGRDFVASKINNLTLASGLNIRVGKIEGSLYGAMVLRDVQVRDAKGVFATSPEIALDWRPFSYLRNRIDIRNLASPEVRLLRLPALKPSGDPNAPLLPDINLDIAQLNVARIDIDPAVDGRRHIGRLRGSAHLSDGRARIMADAATIVAPGVAGGDRLVLKLDAVPARDRLDIDMKLDAPAKGWWRG
jgi:translocation and assembly module TamB